MRSSSTTLAFIALTFIVIALALNSSPAYSKKDLIIQNFEVKKGLISKTKNLNRKRHTKDHPGKSKYAGAWDSQRIEVSTVFTKDKNWSSYSVFSFLLHSERINDQKISLALYSQNIESKNQDFYNIDISVDWIGWRRMNIKFSEFTKKHQPIGFTHIDFITFRAHHTPSTANKLQHFMIDEIKLIY